MPRHRRRPSRSGWRPPRWGRPPPPPNETGRQRWGGAGRRAAHRRLATCSAPARRCTRRCRPPGPAAPSLGRPDRHRRPLAPRSGTRGPAAGESGGEAGRHVLDDHHAGRVSGELSQHPQQRFGTAGRCAEGDHHRRGHAGLRGRWVKDGSLRQRGGALDPPASGGRRASCRRTGWRLLRRRGPPGWACEPRPPPRWPALGVLDHRRRGPTSKSPPARDC